MRRDPQAEARRLVNLAADAEAALDRHNAGIGEAIGTAGEIQELYRRGFDLAQTIGADFFEELAYEYGFSTPAARERYGNVLDGAVPIESLYDGVVQSPAPLRPRDEELEAAFDLPTVEGLGW
jgi:hypothetical protein